MTKKNYNLMNKKIIFSLILIFSFLSAYSENNKWVVASEPFLLSNNSDNEVLKSCTKTLPSLILESLNDDVERRIKSEEDLERKLYDFQKERLSLFLQLSNEVKTRDAIFLNNYSKSKLKSKIKESEKNIKQIKEKIAKNLKQEDKVKSEYKTKIEAEENIRKRRENGETIVERTNYFKNFFGKYEAPIIENVSLYQNDFRKLYTELNSTLQTDYSLEDIQLKLVNAKINCLITGKITSYEDFISVSVALYNYPGGKVIGYATDVGSISELNALAQNLANRINPKLTDSIPVQISVEVNPPEVKKSCVLLIDNVVYGNNNFENIVLSSGVHTLNFSAKDYNSVSLSYNFNGNRNFKVDVELTPKSPSVVNLRFKNVYEGNVFANGVFSGKISAKEPYAQISVNNKNVLGHFINTDGTSADFYISEKLLVDNLSLKANLKTFDRSKYIDKRRKAMYGSYSMLIISLMPYFFCYGNYNSFVMAQKNGTSIDLDQARTWQTATNVSMGVSIAAGGLFIYELIRYLVAANSVLPVKASKLSLREAKKLEKKDKQYIEKQAILKEKEAKKIEEENLKSEEKKKDTQNSDEKEQNQQIKTEIINSDKME